MAADFETDRGIVKKGIVQKRRRKSHKKKYSDRFLSSLREKLRIRPLREVTNKAIQEAYRACKEDAVLTAALLGIGKTTVYRYLNQSS